MADLQKYKPLLHDNPLCGIDTYKDTLDLATGVCTRQIKKYVLTGNEAIGEYEPTYTRISIAIPELTSIALRSTPCLSSHYIGIYDGRPIDQVPNNAIYTGGAGEHAIIVKENDYTTSATFRTYLQAQYAVGTPVTIWFAISPPTTETIIVPSGLSGTVEGYLIQDGTPTPTSPIYPTANNVEVWHHSLKKFDGAAWQNASVNEF